MTTKFVGASGKNGREREIIPVPEGMTYVKTVMEFFQCDRRTAKASMERGYYIVDYHRRTLCPGPLDPETAYRLVWSIYRRKYLDRLPWYVAPEDLVQEGVLRLLEMAGHPRFQERGFQFYLALNAMKGWIERQRRMRGGINGTTPGYEETLRQNAWSSWQTAWQAVRDKASDKPGKRANPFPPSSEASVDLVRHVHAADEDVGHVGWGQHLGISVKSKGRKVVKAIEAGLVEDDGCTTTSRGQAIRLTAKRNRLIGVVA
ncbi:MAG: hypothetical protein PHX53_10825 [Syntrophales bacterium]|nr:hypothetical protein [Syntrophales bacterium]